MKKSKGTPSSPASMRGGESSKMHRPRTGNPQAKRLLITCAIINLPFANEFSILAKLITSCVPFVRTDLSQVAAAKTGLSPLERYYRFIQASDFTYCLDMPMISPITCTEITPDDWRCSVWV